MAAHPSLEAPDLVLDLDGKLVQVGDRIAYAVTQGRSGQLRIGRVIEIVWEHDGFERWDKEKEYPSTVPTKLRVLVETSAYGSGPEKPTLIQASFRRFVKLSSPPPPPFGAIAKTQEEIAAFAKAWDAKVDASRAKAGA